MSTLPENLSEKQETLANLYALRGGLSLMSELYDKTREVEKQIQEDTQSIAFCEKDIANTPRRVSSEKQKYSETMQSIKNDIDALKKTIVIDDNKIAYSKKDKTREFFKHFLPFLLMTIVSFVFAVLAFVESALEGGSSSALLGIVFLLPFLLGISLVRERLGDLKYCDKCVEESEMEKSKHNKEIKKLYSDLKKLKEEQELAFSTFEKKGDETNAELQNRIAEAIKQRGERQAELKELNSKFDIAYTAVKNAFSPILDERDWANLDLIIFNYETGRALDLRDALIQVDQERRNERLVNAIQAATRAISGAIRSGFGELTRVMDEKFAKLDASIVHLSGGIGTLSAISEAQGKALQSGLRRIGDISSAQEALQRKMLTSSDKMADDVAYMREISNRTYYGY